MNVIKVKKRLIGIRPSLHYFCELTWYRHTLSSIKTCIKLLRNLNKLDLAGHWMIEEMGPRSS